MRSGKIKNKFMNQDNRGFINIAVVVIIVVVIGVVGYFAFNKKSKTPDINLNNQNETSTVPTTSTTTETTVLDETANWQTYQNNEYGFEFKYPKESKLLKYPEYTMEYVIEFEKESSFYNRADVAFRIYKKGDVSLPSNNKCKIYNLSSRVIGGKNAEIIEHKDCLGNEASDGPNYKMTVKIYLSDKYDLFYDANLGNDFIRTNDFGNKILQTLKFF